ncbi:MerR family transcriptional regulator [Amycolatopsis sp. lyj-84]|uniref:MerR family transcriptional regulator n=1 Tax=Amycolatopsis sp. lyj-84 TaxID=2789284 RepID=UPI003979BE2C
MSVASAAQQVGTSGTPDADSAELVAAALRLDADTLVAVLEAYIARVGVAATWTSGAGRPWSRPANSASEHVKRCVDVVHLLSSAITIALHRIRSPSPATPCRPPVLLACMPGERHTLPLEALRAALGDRHIPVHCFGANLPISALLHALHRTIQPAAALILWSHRPIALPAAIRKACAVRGIELFVPGPGWITPYPGVISLTSITHALSIFTNFGLGPNSGEVREYP